MNTPKRWLTFAFVSLVGCSAEAPVVVNDADVVPRERVDGGRPESDGATPEDATAALCSSNDECGDAVFCNGQEICAPGEGADARGCVAATAACLEGQTCDEAADRCTTNCAASRDADGDGADAIECGGDDCNDADPRTFPGNTERCDADAHDEDCDPTTFGFRDADGDGFPDAMCCNVSSEGARLCGTDCDDLTSIVHPTEAESCDTLDNDCDGTVDEGVMGRVFRDADGDDFGDPTTARDACHASDGYVSNDGDCDDTNAARNPGAPEICDGVDNDCDGQFGPFEDNDGDGYADAGCGGDDCDDSAWAIHPGALDFCSSFNGDWDCDGVSPDMDGDGYLAVGDTCDPGETGAAPPSGDCDDDDYWRAPGRPETCDGTDEDCDARIDEGADATCDLPGFDATCVAGECVAVRADGGVGCAEHFDECTADSSDGCEDLRTNVNHCGRCGNECLFACSDGACGEVTSLSLGFTSYATLSTGRVVSFGSFDEPALLAVEDIASYDRVCQLDLGGVTTCGSLSFDDVIARTEPYVEDRYGLTSVHVLHRDGRVCRVRQNSDGDTALEGCLDTPWETVAGTTDHLCGLDADGEAHCYASQTYARNKLETGLPSGPFVTIDAALDRACALRASGALVCWTTEWRVVDRDRLGAPTFAAEAGAPVTVDLADVATFDIEGDTWDFTMCATTHAGRAYCWGDASPAYLGDGTLDGSEAPVAVEGVTDAARIFVRGNARCVLHRTGAVSCWGRDVLPHEAELLTPVPVRVE